MVRVWDLESGKCLHTFEGHTNRVVNESGKCLHIFEGHTNRVTSVCLSSDGRRVMSASLDHTFRVWDLETGVCLQILEGIPAVDVSLDGRKAVSTGDLQYPVRVRDLDVGDRLTTLEGDPANVATVFMYSNNQKALLETDGKYARTWSLNSSICSRTLKGISGNVVGLSQSGRRAMFQYHNDLSIWDLETGACLQTLKGVGNASVSSDWRKVMAVDNGYRFRALDLETGSRVYSREIHPNSVTSVTLSLGGRKAVSISNHILRVWDTQTGACLHRLRDDNAEVNCVVISPDGRKAVSGNGDGTIRVWDLETGACLHTMEGYNRPERSGDSNCVAISPDGWKAVSGSDDKTIRVWDIDAGIHLGSYYADSPFKWCLFLPCELIFCQTLVGNPYFLTPVNFPPPGPAITTAYSPEKAQCALCGAEFRLSVDVKDAIAQQESHSVSRSPFNVSQEAFNDHRLLSSCPNCGESLKFNPFFAG